MYDAFVNDIFSLGVILFMMQSGIPPFDRQDHHYDRENLISVRSSAEAFGRSKAALLCTLCEAKAVGNC